MAADTEAMFDEWYRSGDFATALGHYVAERRDARRRRRERCDAEAAEVRRHTAWLPDEVDSVATAFLSRMIEYEDVDRVVWDGQTWRWPMRSRRASLRRRPLSTSELLARFERVRERGQGRWIARCPSHEDHSPSLSMTRKPDRLLLHCFAGCPTGDVLAAVGADWADLFVESS